MMNGHAFLYAAIFLLGIFPGAGVMTEADKLYRQGKYEEAAQKYREALKSDPDSAIMEFNLGTALYKQELYPEAAGHFQRALLSDDPGVRQKAHYNLGSAFYRRGIEQEAQDPGAAVRQLERSLDHLKESLKIAPDPDAEHNLEFVKKELERLKQKKQQEEKEKRQEDPQKTEQKSQQKSQENSQENSQDKNQRPQENKDGPSGEDQQDTERAEQPQEQREEGRQDPQETADGSEDSAGRPQNGEAPASFAPGRPQGRAEDLDEREALKLIEEYQQNEKPGGMMNLLPRRQQPPVLKDW